MTHHRNHPFLVRPLGLVAGALLLAGLAACSEDDADASPDKPAPVVTAERKPDDTPDLPADDPDHGDDDHEGGDAPSTVQIAGVDYSFEDVPESVPAGTKLGFRNGSEAELHELVAFRLPDDETASVDELLLRPADELMPLLGAPVTVILQVPGTDTEIVAVGDGVLSEPGRYLLACFIPIGADPQEYLDAAAAAGGGAPQGVAGGPPHFTAGMYAELTVTG